MDEREPRRDPARPGEPRSDPAGAGVAIEAAAAADAADVIALIGRVFEEYGLVLVPADEVPDLLAFDRHYGAPRGAFFVAREAGVLVGSVGVERRDADTAEVHRLYLDMRLRGRGIGRALLEAAIAWSRAAGAGHLVLWSDTRFDRAHALYERMGFRRTGEREVPDVNQSREYRYERSA